MLEMQRVWVLVLAPRQFGNVREGNKQPDFDLMFVAVNAGTCILRTNMFPNPDTTAAGTTSIVYGL